MTHRKNYLEGKTDRRHRYQEEFNNTQRGDFEIKISS